MRLAYLAQHAFHQLEEHQDKTAVEYILWRFAGVDDRESLENQSKEVNVDDEKLRLVPWFICPTTFDIKKCSQDNTAEAKKERSMVVRPEAILERQKHTKTNEYIYKVKWHQKPMECTTWVKCETLLSMGYPQHGG